MTSLRRSASIAPCKRPLQEERASELFESKPCLLCEGRAAELVYAYPANYYDHARWETASWDGRISAPLTIVRCPRCELVFSRPSFRERALEHVYPQDLIDPELVYQGSVYDLPRVLEARGQTHVDVLVLDDVLEHLVVAHATWRRAQARARQGSRPARQLEALVSQLPVALRR